MRIIAIIWGRKGEKEYDECSNEAFKRSSKAGVQKKLQAEGLKKVDTQRRKALNPNQSLRSRYFGLLMRH